VSLPPEKTPGTTRSAKIAPQILLLALPVVGSFILFRQVPPMPSSRLTTPDMQAQIGGIWNGPRRLELAAALTARVHIGMDQQIVKIRLGPPDRIRDIRVDPLTELWSYRCRDTRQRFIFVNRKLQSEDTLPYQSE